MNKKKNQKEIYKQLKLFAEARGMTKENCSMLTLLLHPGCEFGENDLISLVRKLMKPLKREYVAVFEPVVAEPELYVSANFDLYRDPLPFYHVHILVKEFDREIRALKSEWFKLIGKSKKRLFHCSHIKESIASALNYMTKYFEEKRDAEPVFIIEEGLKKKIMKSSKSIDVRTEHDETKYFEDKIAGDPAIILEEGLKKKIVEGPKSINVRKEQNTIETSTNQIFLEPKFKGPKQFFAQLLSRVIKLVSFFSGIVAEISRSDSS